MFQPTLATVKRLFAVSRNECAFPKCTIPIVDAASGKVTGRICHIKARQPDGPRFDPAQTQEERHAFSNLILLCPIHHDVIDADIEAYTISRLSAMKSDHESGSAVGEPSDPIALQLLTVSNVISSGSVITSVGQIGGQLAHSITNIVIAPSPAVDLQAVISRETQPSIILSTLRVRIRNVGQQQPTDARLRICIPARYIRHGYQVGYIATEDGNMVFERSNEFFLDQHLFQQLYPGEVSKQVIQEIHYYTENPYLREQDVAEISIRSGSAPEFLVRLRLVDLDKLESGEWYNVSRAGEIYKPDRAAV